MPVSRTQPPAPARRSAGCDQLPLAPPTGLPREAVTPAIVHHPDVRRMLLSMRAATDAMRALAYFAAAAINASRNAADRGARFRAQRRADLLIPVVKAWCTDLGIEVA